MRLIDADALHLAMIRKYDEVEDLIEIIDEQPTISQWIPVSERLPDVIDYALITFEEINGMNRVDKAICCSHGWQTETRYINFDKVLAWMPLPEPYKGDEDE